MRPEFRFARSLFLVLSLLLLSFHARAETFVGNRPLVWSDYLGVNSFFSYTPPELYHQQISRWKALGLVWVREGLHWAILEPQADKPNLTALDEVMKTLQQEQLQSLVYLAGSARYASSAPPNSPYFDKYPPTDTKLYAHKIAALAQRYPMVNAWQIWNEPNSPGFWQPQPDVPRLLQLMTESSIALRAIAPNKPVVMPGMAYFSQIPGQKENMFQSLGRLGGLRQGWVAAYHPYLAYPEGTTEDGSDFITTTRTLNDYLRTMGTQQIWATEWGWSSYAGPVEEQPIIGEDKQADYILRRLSLLTTLDFDRVFLFDLSDLDERATVRDRSYGLLRVDASPKPAYNALRNFLRFAGNRLRPIPAGTQLPPAPTTVQRVVWQRADDSQLWLFWGKTGELTLPTNAKDIVLYDPLSGREDKLERKDKTLMISAKPTIQMLAFRAERN